MDDLISRKAVIDAIHKNGCNTRRILDAVEALPSAQPEIKTDGDTISRQQTIDALMQEFKRIPTNSIRAKLVVENLPSAQHERKTGRWIKPTGMMPPEHHGHYECSECGAWAMRPWLRPRKGVVLTDFCPACGIPMLKDGEG